MIVQPVNLDEFHKDIKRVFRGMWLESTGTITVAYHAPIMLRQIEVGRSPLMTADIKIYVPKNERIVLTFAPWKG